MILWILTTLLTAVVAVMISVPFVRRLDAPRAEKSRIVDQSRAQLAELDAQVAGGALTEDEASETRREVERRVLAAIKAEAAAPALATDRSRMTALTILGGWVVLGGAVLYWIVGQPTMPGVPRTGLASAPMQQSQAAVQAADAAATTAPAAAGGGAATGSVEEMIAGLVAKLEANPDDVAGWQMLGWSYFKTERYAMAADAYGKAVALDGSNADVWSAYGEVLVRTANGLVTDLAVTAFDSALAINPGDPRARFFKGMKLEQDGDPQAAIDAWLEIYDSAPAGADYVAGLVQRIQESAAANGVDLGDRLANAPVAAAPMDAGSGVDLLPPSGGASAAPGPTAADVAAAQQMSPQDQQAMINGMVERLASRLEANPDDPEGWARLINARMVLGDQPAAQAAYDKAAEIFAAEPDKLALVKAGAAQAGLSVN